MGSCPFYPAEAVGGPSARGEGNHSSAALPLQPSESSSPLLYTHQQALEGQVVESGRVQLVCPGDSQDVSPLLSLLDDCCDVVRPGDVQGHEAVEKPGCQVRPRVFLHSFL